MSENPVRRKFFRHIDIKQHFVRKLVLAWVLKLVPLRTRPRMEKLHSGGPRTGK